MGVALVGGGFNRSRRPVALSLDMQLHVAGWLDGRETIVAK